MEQSDARTYTSSDDWLKQAYHNAIPDDQTLSTLTIGGLPASKISGSQEGSNYIDHVYYLDTNTHSAAEFDYFLDSPELSAQADEVSKTFAFTQPVE